MYVPEFWLIAGPNGAGKTTCVQRKPIASLIPHVKFFNPDELTLKKLRASGFQGFADAPIEIQRQFFLQSADDVLARLQKAIAHRKPVGVETVLSTDKYWPLVFDIGVTGGFVGLIYVALSSPMIAKARVAARVKNGGHGIPDDLIEKRWHRSLEMLGNFARNSSAFWILDNSDSTAENPPLLLASGKRGVLNFLAKEAFPELRAALSKVPTE